MTNKQVEISMAEWDVMNIIWDKKSVSANEIVVEIQKYKEDDIKMKTAKTFLNKLYGGDMKSLVLNFAKNEELNNKEIEELRDILNDISKK